MNKRDYLHYKKVSPMLIIYNYYKEKFDHKKHKPFLSQNEFFPYIQANYDINLLYANVTRYYDNHFGIITIADENGNLITQY